MTNSHLWDAQEKLVRAAFWILYLGGVAVTRLVTSSTEQWILAAAGELLIATVFIVAMRANPHLAALKNASGPVIQGRTPQARRMFSLIAIYSLLVLLVYGIAAGIAIRVGLSLAFAILAIAVVAIILAIVVISFEMNHRASRKF